MAVYFYDGLECYRPHEQNPGGVARPRGYSCEELGGACYGLADDFPRMTRLSRTFPLFVSPHGTGCSRYVDALVTPQVVGVRLHGTVGRPRIVYQPNGGNAGANITFTLCNRRGSRDALALILSNSGRLRSKRAALPAAAACAAGL